MKKSWKGEYFKKTYPAKRNYFLKRKSGLVFNPVTTLEEGIKEAGI